MTLPLCEKWLPNPQDTRPYWWHPVTGVVKIALMNNSADSLT